MPALTVGLTGGIASGKSWVAAQFEQLGVPVLDADQVSREIVLPGSPALAEIGRQFGSGFITPEGSLDRRRMREHVFADETERRRLEAILHPRMHQHMRDWRDRQTTPYCMLSAAILLETRMRELVDRVLVVDASEAVQRQRLTTRDGIDLELATRMMAAQARREDRLAAADDILHNDASMDESLQQVRQLHELYLQIAAEPRNSR